MSKIQSSIKFLFSQLVVYSLNNNTKHWKRLFSRVMKRVFVKYNSNKLYILYKNFIVSFFHFLCYIKITHLKLFIYSFLNKKMLFKKKKVKVFFWECSWGFWAVFGKGGVNSWAVYNSGLLSVPCLSSLSIRTHRDVYQSNKTARDMHTSRLSVYGQSQWLPAVSVVFREDWPCILLATWNWVHFYAMMNIRKESGGKKSCKFHKLVNSLHLVAAEKIIFHD